MKNKLYEEIKLYRPYNEQEEKDKNVMLKFIETFDDCFTRNNEIGHFTTSAWIVNETKDKVLMVYHNIYDSYAWIGGHADGDSNLLNVIRKEIEEECGLKNIKLLSDGIYGISVQTTDSHIKNKKYVNCHLHFDVQYLFEASEFDKVRINEKENSDVKWISIDKVLDIVTEEHMKPLYKKMIDKMTKII